MPGIYKRLTGNNSVDNNLDVIKRTKQEYNTNNSTEPEIVAKPKGVKPNEGDNTPSPTTTTVPEPKQDTPVLTETQALSDYVKELKEKANKSTYNPKKEKNRAIINAVTDGLGALANVYFASKGAPPMGTTHLSERQQLARQRLKAEHDKDRQAWMQANLMLAKANDLAKQREEEKKYRDSLLQFEIADAERENQLHELKMQLEQNKIDKAQYDKKAAEINARYAEAKAKADIAAKNRSNKQTTYTLLGKTYTDENAYHDAIYKEAKSLGIDDYKNVGTNWQPRQVRKHMAELKAEIEQRHNNKEESPAEPKGLF